MKDIKNASLLAHNTFGIDVRCHRLLEFSSTEEALQLVKGLQKSDCPYLLLGGGSNLLLTGDYPGTVITPENRFEVTVFTCPGDEDGVCLRCWAGSTFDEVVEYAVKHGFYGAENLSLIPGQVGASAIQNIGAYGAEACEIITEVEAVEIATARLVHLSNADCQYGYRKSRFKREWRDQYLITAVTYRLTRTFTPKSDYGSIRRELEAKGINNPTAEQMRQIIIAIRQAKLPDPKVQGNAGSFFMNPMVTEDKFKSLQGLYPDMPFFRFPDPIQQPDGNVLTVKIPAGWMIDQCGWKGKSLGRAGVHDKQALVLVNRGGATGQEVLTLCKTIQNDVNKKFGIQILPEVNIK
jgi:UDP-N-acetylmuramate dehydrogenase